MFRYTVTMFTEVDGVWKPTVISQCHLERNVSTGDTQSGETEQNRVTLHFPYKYRGTDRIVSGKKFYPEKAFNALQSKNGAFTIKTGDTFSFFVVGSDTSSYTDANYPAGFYHYYNRTHDDVYAVSSYQAYDVIPHFEVSAG